MNWFKHWIVERLLIDVVNELLNKIPLNNRKTLLGFLVTVVSILLYTVAAEPASYSDVLNIILSLLVAQGGVSFVQAGEVIAVIGIFHKWLKRIAEQNG